jgi:hypothetical protein
MSEQEHLQKLIDECQQEIAKKYKLGEKLVTGHRKGFFDEATKLLVQKLSSGPMSDWQGGCLQNIL